MCPQTPANDNNSMVYLFTLLITNAVFINNALPRNNNYYTFGCAKLLKVHRTSTCGMLVFQKGLPLHTD